MTALRPLLAVAALAALVTAGLALRSHWIGIGAATVQARWDAQTRADLRASLALQRERQADQLTRIRNAERNADEQARRDVLRATRDARAAVELGGLRATIAHLDRRELPAAGDAAGLAALAGEAATGRELLGQCAQRYRKVAADADELRDQVSGLQADAIDVCRAGASGAPHPSSTEPETTP